MLDHRPSNAVPEENQALSSGQTATSTEVEQGWGQEIERASRRLPLFVSAALCISVLGILEWSDWISGSTFRYLRTLVWAGLFALVYAEFRRLEIQSVYFRRVFYSFSVMFLLELVVELPIFRTVFPRTGSVFPIVDIVSHSGWTVSCGLLLYGLLVSVKSKQMESRAKDVAIRKVESSELQLLTMFEAAKDSVFVKDSSLRYVRVNKSMEELFNSSRGELVGSSDVELFGESAAGVQTEDERVLAGATVDTQTTKMVNGVPHTFHVIKVPLRDETGEIFGLFGIARDITDRCEADAAARLTQFSIDRAVDAVLWILEDGTIDYANESARKSLSLYNLEEKPKIWSVDLRFQPDSWKTFWMTMRSASDNSYETRFHSEGGPVAMEVRANRFTYQQTELLCMFARDISERKRLQIEAQQRLSELSHLSRLQIANEMVAGMAHELNQPLATVANYSHIIASDLAKEDSAAWQNEEHRRLVAEKSRIVCDEAIRAGEIIRRLRTLVNKREHQRTITGINELVAETLRIFGLHLLADSNPAIQESWAEEAMVCVDQIQIQQILLNLLSNARDAVSEKQDEPTISISTFRRKDHSVVVSVQDNGSGFGDLGVENLFQPFVSSKNDGMGLGLAISRSIARAHGGELQGQPSPTGGALFELSLPVEN